jgi:hypothetical protein
MLKNILWLLCLSALNAHGQKPIRIVFTSDVHYGLTRHFRGVDKVSSKEVNDAQITAIKKLGKIDAIIITGDIANRQEPPVQSAAASWQEFLDAYGSLHIPLLLVPGNHDVSNAIGYYKPMHPLKDAASLSGIYEMELHKKFKDYSHQKVNYAKDIGGIHFEFINIWPDSANRLWMEQDLQSVKPGTPVFVFAHDPPEGDPKHFTNPNGIDAVAGKDTYENILQEHYSDHAEQGWIRFLATHPQIKAYFHGHANYHAFYSYKGVPAFRCDSPIKGKFSSKDDTLLSFDLITIYPRSASVEVKQIYWNKAKKLITGEVKTIHTRKNISQAPALR